MTRDECIAGAAQVLVEAAQRIAREDAEQLQERAA